jgi:hypothetical protein
MIDAKLYSPVLFDNNLDPSRLKKGTAAYHRFWEEQYRRCIDGYKPTGGSWIPGNYYFYLNFSNISVFDTKINRKKMGPPLYRDQDHEYFVEAKNAECGMGAQKEHYVSDFYKKLLMSYNNIYPQFRNKYLLQNKDIFKSGYKEKQDGIWVEKGMGSMCYFRLIEKPDTFRGTSLTWWIVDEAGEVINLKQVYFANEECFREGAHQYGCPIIGGTSNKMSHDSDDFMQMWYKAEEYNLKRFFVPASKVYHGFFDRKTGISDTEGAALDIKARLAEKVDDKAAWYTFKQEMPLTPEDAFVVHGSTPFDLEKINNRITQLNTNKDLRIWRRGRLRWPENKSGNKVVGGKPIFEFDEHGPMMMIDAPIENMKNAHIAAVDPYHVADDLEEEKPGKVSKRDSKGCMSVYRRFVDMHNQGEMQVFEYYDRPYSKEEFYENCLMIAVYYDCQVLVEYNDDAFLKYFIGNGMTRYLMKRPKSADSPWSQAKNSYGIHMKSYQKNLLIELVDEYVKHNIDSIYNVPLLKEMAVFGVKNTDRVMAFGMSLIADMDNTKRVKMSNEEETNPYKSMPEYVQKDGMLVLKQTKNGSDPFNLNSLYQ